MVGQIDKPKALTLFNFVEFFYERNFSNEYKLISDFSKLLAVFWNVIYTDLAKRENYLARRVTYLLVNSRIFCILMQLEFQNFLKSDRAFTAKNDVMIFLFPLIDLGNFLPFPNVD